MPADTKVFKTNSGKATDVFIQIQSFNFSIIKNGFLKLY